MYNYKKGGKTLNMKTFYKQNKKSLITFLIIFSFLLMYDLFLITHINDLSKVKSLTDIQILYENHPFLPLSRLIFNLYPVQYFNVFGFKEFIITMCYIINSLSIFEILFMVLLLINLWQFLFKRDRVNTLTMIMVLMQSFVFIIHIIYSLVKIFNSMVFVNYPIRIAMNSIRIFSIIILVVYLCILCSCLFTIYIFSVNKN